MHLGALTVAEQHLSCHKGIVPLPVTLPVVDGLKISVLINLVGPGLFQFAQAKAFNKLLFQLAFNKHLQVMVLKWS